MRRRHFLKTIPAAVTGVLSGCNADDLSLTDSGTPESTSRRHFPQSVASGDPRPTSAVVWTRAIDPDLPGSVSLELEVALDSEFERRLQFGDAEYVAVQASSAHDHCVRVRLDSLEPATDYFYRFVYPSPSGRHSSRVGKFKTAAQAEADAPARFAVMSCQDYSARYFHCQALASQLDLDFFVFLGDYIYETADAPSFQQANAERSVVFDDADGALVVEGSGEQTYYAARSLDNYRQLYRTYRQDRNLQALHEQLAMVAVWDDHEFSNDGYGQNATYTNGRLPELDPERRANADQAWFEYMPVDYPAGPDFEYDRDAPFPENLRIYRDFHFGRHLHLLMTDLRRYRSGHVLSGAELPGAIALTAAQLLRLEAAPEFAEPYVDIDGFEDGDYGDAIRAALDTPAAPYASESIRGNLAVAFVNDLLLQLDVDLPPITSTLDFPLGVPYSATGKTEVFSASGAHYFVADEAFRLISRSRFLETDGESEQIMGAAQEAWFLRTAQASSSTWKVWGNEYTLMKRVADLSDLPVPDALAQRFTVSADDWDGAPNRRLELLQQLEQTTNVVVLTGDLHSFFAGNLGVGAGEGIVEFVTGALSSATYASLLTQAGLLSEDLDASALQAGAAGLILQTSNPHMAYQNLSNNGFGVVAADGDTLRVTLYQLPFDSVFEPTLDGPLSEHFSTTEFLVESGSGRIYRDSGDSRRVWDPSEGRWTTA